MKKETYFTNFNDIVIQGCNDSMNVNNEAVSLVNSGCYEKAIVLLTNAMSNIRRLLATSSVGDMEHIPLEQKAQELALDRCLHHSSRDNPFLRNVPSDDGFHASIYSRGILILPGIVQRPGCPHQRITMSSTIIIFNLALAHHLSAWHRVEGPRKLRISLKLYHLVLDLLEKKDNQHSFDVLLILATVNNLAIIQSHFDESKYSSVESFEYLLSTLLLLAARGGEGHSYDRNAFAGFQSNAISVLVKPIEFLAPAA